MNNHQPSYRFTLHTLAIVGTALFFPCTIAGEDSVNIFSAGHTATASSAMDLVDENAFHMGFYTLVTAGKKSTFSKWAVENDKSLQSRKITLPYAIGTNARIAIADFGQSPTIGIDQMMSHTFFRWIAWIDNKKPNLCWINDKKAAKKPIVAVINAEGTLSLAGRPVQHEDRSVSLYLFDRKADGTAILHQVTIDTQGKTIHTAACHTFNQVPKICEIVINEKGVPLFIYSENGGFPVFISKYDSKAGFTSLQTINGNQLQFETPQKTVPSLKILGIAPYTVTKPGSIYGAHLLIQNETNDTSIGILSLDLERCGSSAISKQALMVQPILTAGRKSNALKPIAMGQPNWEGVHLLARSGDGALLYSDGTTPLAPCQDDRIKTENTSLLYADKRWVFCVQCDKNGVVSFIPLWRHPL